MALRFPTQGHGRRIIPGPKSGQIGAQVGQIGAQIGQIGAHILLALGMLGVRGGGTRKGNFPSWQTNRGNCPKGESSGELSPSYIDSQFSHFGTI